VTLSEKEQLEVNVNPEVYKILIGEVADAIRKDRPGCVFACGIQISLGNGNIMQTWKYRTHNTCPVFEKCALPFIELDPEFFGNL
jgi:hypothetical protein